MQKAPRRVSPRVQGHLRARGPQYRAWRLPQGGHATKLCLKAKEQINILDSSLGYRAGAAVANSPLGRTPRTMSKGGRSLSLCR